MTEKHVFILKGFRGSVLHVCMASSEEEASEIYSNGEMMSRPSDHEQLYPSWYSLYDYSTMELIRCAMKSELHDSIASEVLSGGRGLIDIDGRPCYVDY